MCQKTIQTSSLSSAAKQLGSHLQIPVHCYSITSHYLGDGHYALHLSINKSWKHVKSNVPDTWKGFPVITDIAGSAIAY